MKKILFLRCLAGAPIGLAISTCITMLISVSIGDGYYHPVAPELTTLYGNELNAVWLQAACSLVYGAAWGGATLVWQMERWSLLRQTLTHLVVCSAASFPIAYFMYWMPHNMRGALLYFGTFAAIYLVIWLCQYAAISRRIRRMNENIRKNEET